MSCCDFMFRDWSVCPTDSASLHLISSQRDDPDGMLTPWKLLICVDLRSFKIACANGQEVVLNPGRILTSRFVMLAVRSLFRSTQW